MLGFGVIRSGRDTLPLSGVAFTMSVGRGGFVVLVVLVVGVVAGSIDVGLGGVGGGSVGLSMMLTKVSLKVVSSGSLLDVAIHL